MHHQHVIDWYRSRGYRVTVLSDWSLQCISETAWLMADAQQLQDAISRNHREMWK